LLLGLCLLFLGLSPVQMEKMKIAWGKIRV
jgi:hypothetical protein